MRVDLFDFDLPEDAIALRPAEPRGSSRLLHVCADGSLADRFVRDLPSLLRAGDVVVRNDTRVIPARLRGVRQRGDVEAKIEALLHLRLSPSTWRCFARRAKKLRVGDTLRFGTLTGAVEGVGEGGEVDITFDRAATALDVAIEAEGELPLPPYVESKRAVDLRDTEDYQTVYANEPGAVAAPTAGLHWTADLEDALTARGISVATATLHVGAGTFLPVKADDTDDHRMHAEWGRIDRAAVDCIHAARNAGGRIIAIGTTTLRLLEAAAAQTETLQPWSGETDIFITPGYRFRIVDALMTNFHLPRSTLFMLVSAFSGLDTMRAAYEHAIAGGYRFYSYGDASLLERAT